MRFGLCLAVLVLLAGCSGEGVLTKPDPIPPAVPLDLPLIAEIGGIGYESAVIGDQAAGRVGQALDLARRLNGEGTTSGTLTQVNNRFTYSPGPPSKLVVIYEGAPSLEIVVREVSGFNLYPGSENRVSGLWVHGRLRARVTVAGSYDLELTQQDILQESSFGPQSGYRRTVTGTLVTATQRLWNVDLVHEGYETFPGHAMEGNLQVSGRVISTGADFRLNERARFQRYEFFYQPGGSAGQVWSWTQKNTGRIAGEGYTLSANIRGSLSQDGPFRPKRAGAGWVADGGLTRSGDAVGRIEFAAPIDENGAGADVVLVSGESTVAYRKSGVPPTSLLTH